MPATTPKTKTKKPQDHKPKSTFGTRVVYPVTVPSGSTIQMIRPGVQGLTKAGIIDSFDQLTSIVQGETIPKAEGRPPVDVIKASREAAKDPKRVADMLDMMDKIVMHVVQEPRLYDVPVLTDEQKAEGLSVDDIRDDSLHYIDYVDEVDKTFIMNVSMGGSTDLERFREESAKAMGGIPALEADADAGE